MVFWTIKRTNCTRHIDNYLKCVDRCLLPMLAGVGTEGTRIFLFVKTKYMPLIRRIFIEMRVWHTVGEARTVHIIGWSQLCIVSVWLRSSTFYRQFNIGMDMRNAPQLNYSNVSVYFGSAAGNFFCNSISLSLSIPHCVSVRNRIKISMNAFNEKHWWYNMQMNKKEDNVPDCIPVSSIT